MTKIKLLLIILVNVIMVNSAYSQLSSITKNYDYFLTGDNDYAEGIACNSSNQFYVAGVNNFTISGATSIHIIKYSSAGAELSKIDYTNTDYNVNHVIKVLLNSVNVYVTCTATNKNTGVHTVLVIKANPGLTSTSASTYTGYDYVTDACIDGAGDIYIACNKENGGSYSAAIMKISNSTLSIVGTPYLFYYSSLTDAYKEMPTSIYYHAYDNSIYAVGQVVNPDNTTAPFIVKVSTTTSLVWKNVLAFAPGNNSYASVAGYNSNIYVTGSAYATRFNGAIWITSRYSNTGTASLATYGFPHSPVLNSKVTGAKVTLANATHIVVVAYIANAGSQDLLYAGNFPAALGKGSYSLYGFPRPLNSSYSDAASSANGDTYITGVKAVGTSGYMYFYGINALHGGSIFYKDSTVSSTGSSFSTKLALAPSGNSDVVAVTGGADADQTGTSPDNEFFTKIYSGTPPAGVAVENNKIESKLISGLIFLCYF